MSEMSEILEKFYINLTTIVTTLFLGYELLRRFSYKINKKIYLNIIQGIYCGLIGMALIYFNIAFPDIKIVVDLRLIVPALAAFMGGGIASVIAATIATIFRIVWFPWTPDALITHIISFYFLVAVSTLIFRTSLSSIKKWAWMLVTIEFTFFLIMYNLLYEVQPLSTIIMLVSSHFTITSISILIISGLLGYLKNAELLLEKFETESTIDFLTGLNNVRKFDAVLKTYIEKSKKNHTPLSFILFDIDDFKSVNDHYGHKGGDEVLKQLASVVKENCRPNDEVSRNGGEEFSVLLPNCNKNEAILVAEKIRKTIETYSFMYEKKRISITVSIGVSTFLEDQCNILEMLTTTDGLLYQAKKTGKNKVCC